MRNKYQYVYKYAFVLHKKKMQHFSLKKNSSLFHSLFKYSKSKLQVQPPFHIECTKKKKKELLYEP